MAAAANPVTHQPYTLEKDGFRTTFYSRVGRCGTPIEPPAHVALKGATLDHIPLQEVVLPLVVFDATQLLAKDPNQAQHVAQMTAWEKTHGPLAKSAFAALRTDMSRQWTANPECFKRFPFPAWSLEAVRFLFEQRGVTANPLEALATDRRETLDSAAWRLKQGHWPIEPMAKLAQEPATGAVIVVIWPKVANRFGFPTRAFVIRP